MADTKVENETELFTLDGDEYYYVVDDPAGTPAPRKVSARVAGGMPSLKSGRSWGVVLPGGHQNSTATTLGQPSATAFGSAGGSNAFATTNERTRRKRIPQTTGASAGSSAGFWGNSRLLLRGGASGRGGFRTVFRFAVNTMPATWRMFAGISTTISQLGNADPSSLLNLAGVGKDVGDTAWQVMSNDGTSTATKHKALNTTNFPINDTTAVFEFEMHCPPGNAQNITWWMRNISGVDANGSDSYSSVDTGTMTTDMPAVDTVMTWHLWINNETTAAAAIIDMMRVYFESYGGD